MPASAEDFAFCEAMVRREDADRWLAGLFIPQPFRLAVFALYAFNLEIARVRNITSEPLIGEIRYQWWREAIEGERASEAQANPVAAALLDIVERFGLPRSELLDLIEARYFDLNDEPMQTVTALELYASATASSLLRLVLLILDKDNAAGGFAIAEHGGIAYAITGLLRALPWTLDRRQIFVPLQILRHHAVEPQMLLDGKSSSQILASLAEMRALARKHLKLFKAGASAAPASVAAAFLPLSLCELYLRQMDKKSYDPFKSAVDLPKWRRQWRLWRASKQFAK